MGQILLSMGPWEALPPPSHATPCLPDRQAEGCRPPAPDPVYPCAAACIEALCSLLRAGRAAPRAGPSPDPVPVDMRPP